MLSRIFLVILVLVPFIHSLGTIKNGGAPYYEKLNKSIPLSEKFEMVRKADDVVEFLGFNFLDRMGKIKLMALWMDSYEYPPKYDILNMMDRMLLIQVAVKKMLTTSGTRSDLLRRELNRNKTIDQLIGKENKMQFILNSTKTMSTIPRMNICSYFNFDFNWHEMYNSTVFSPAQQMLSDYYFSKDTMKILGSKKMTVDQKIEKIQKANKDNTTSDEMDLMIQLYRDYLEKNTLSGFFIG